jgi:uncharacterized protein (DUF433 family)
MENISVDPTIHFGKPCLAGTRITVQSVLELLAEGVTSEEIMRDYYPDLLPEHIKACLRYATALVAGEEIHLSSLSA